MEMAMWKKSYETMTATIMPQTSKALEFFAGRFLGLYYNMTSILVDVCLDTSPMVFDRHNAIFANIISHSIQSYHLRFSGQVSIDEARHKSGSFVLNSISDMGWITPLFFTALLCRNHRIRHQAVRLLESAPHKEGIWDGLLAARVAEQVIALEEAHFYDHLKPGIFDKLDPPTKEDMATQPLPESSRMTGVGIVLPDDDSGSTVITCCRKNTAGVIEYIKMAYDLLSGRWRDV
jgi:hypothetical protein